ncbi:MAG: phosphodiesterase, partial [Planctomycetes bacterium RBG_16_64_10]
RGRVLAGMGVPDLRGSLGLSTCYTEHDATQTGESETVIRLHRSASGSIATYLPGPLQPKTKAAAEFPITIDVDSAAGTVKIRSTGTPAQLEVGQRQWSDWLAVKFKLGLLQSVQGVVRFYLGAVTPALQLYASPIHFDPHAPMFPISWPPEYSGDLAHRIGTYHTAGMAEDHGGLSNGRLDEEAFLTQCQDVYREREAMLLDELSTLREGLLFCLFDTPDRVQHMFWRFREPDHPANRAGCRNGFGAVIEDHYRQCDGTVGKVLAQADDATLVVVLSDHGFGSFRRGVHLNTWLHDQGLLALRAGVWPGHDARDLLRDVDWSRTRAYALGLGGIYLNRQGREAQGTVPDQDAEPLKAAIAAELRGLPDQECQAVAVRDVVTREQVYHGPYTEAAPDLLVHFAPGYRASWTTALGGMGRGHFEDNTRKWAGDHIIDPALVPGVLLMNRPHRNSRPRLLDLAPTLLDGFGVPQDPAMQGETLLT